MRPASCSLVVLLVVGLEYVVIASANTPHEKFYWSSSGLPPSHAGDDVFRHTLHRTLYVGGSFRQVGEYTWVTTSPFGVVRLVACTGAKDVSALGSSQACLNVHALKDIILL